MALTVMTGPAQGFGQQQVLPIITLREAIAKTLTNNPGLEAVGYQLRAQEARIVQAAVKPPPELGVELENIFGSGPNDLLRGAQTTFSIAWILDHGLTQRRVESESAQLQLMQVDREVSRLDAAAETARLYLNALALQEEMNLAGAAIDQARTTVDAVAERVDAGAVPPAELARARTELARRELWREDIEHETIGAYYLLGEQWGLTQPDFARVDGDIMQLPALQDFEELRQAISANPSITRYVPQRRLYESQLRLAEATRKPNWRVSAGVRQIEVTGDHAFIADLRVPLARSDSNRGRLEEARANLAHTEAELTRERTHVEIRLYVIYLELQHYLEVAAALRDNIIPLHQQALEDTENAYVQGRYSYQELSTVQAELLEAREELLSNSIEAHRRQIEIERFIGLSIEASQP